MTKMLQLDIPLILPEVPDAADACVGRLVLELRGRPGIEDAHVIAAEADRPALLCIHYDPDLLSLARIRELAQAAGAAIAERYGHARWSVEGIGHQRRSRTVSYRLRAIPGVLEADASAAGMVRVEFDRSATSEESILAVLAELGVRPASAAAAKPSAFGAPFPLAPSGREQVGHKHEPGEKHDHDHAHGGLLGPNTELIFALACGALPPG